MGSVILFSTGTLFFFHGIWLLNGNSKGLYFTKNLRAGGVYAEIPWALGFLLLGVSTLLNAGNIAKVFVDIGIVLLVIGVVLSFVKPSFLKPSWLKFLEREHGDILPLLISEARQVGLEIWQDKIKTLEDLEIWVKEVRHKHKMN